MTFLLPNQQRQSIEGKTVSLKEITKKFLNSSTTAVPLHDEIRSVVECDARVVVLQTELLYHRHVAACH